MAKKIKYKYINYQGVLCRYAFLPNVESYSILGEVYDKNTGKWVQSISSTEYEMSGGGKEISHIDVKKFALAK